MNIPCVRLGKLIRLAGLLNRKSPGPVRTLQILEAVDGDTRGTGGELQQTRLLLRVPAANAFPEVLNNLIILGVSTVVGVLLPVLDVDICDTTDKKLELALIKNIDQILWNKLVEPAKEGVELLLDAFLNAPFCDQSDEVSTGPS